MLNKFFEDKREIYRIHVAHTLREMALSIVSIYIPIYLLTLNYTLTEVIIFYAIFHLSGLMITLFVITPLVGKFGLLRTLKLYYPIEILFYILLYLLSAHNIPIWIIAAVGGSATFMYWVPLNILLVRHSNYDKMGSDLATFFALPKIFKIAGPLLAAILVPTVGFWSVFVLAMIGLVISFLPIAGISRSSVSVTPKISNIFSILKKRKGLFMLEMFDNILEESEWFWGIYVFLVIGTLSSPGITGSLMAIGGALFLLLIGKHANKNSHKLVIIGSILLICVSIAQIFVKEHIMVYIVTVISSFVFTLFLVPYFSIIYRAVKNNNTVEFIILREVPTVLGRLVVFGAILFVVDSPQYLFILPAITSFVLLVIFKLKKW